MHLRIAAAFFLCTAIFGQPTFSRAQSALSLPGCEATPALRAAFSDKLDWKRLEKLKYNESFADQRQVLEELMARYPREFAPVQRYINLLSQGAPEEYATIRTRWVQQATEHPDDPLALLIAGKSLVGQDTPEAIRLLEAARAKAPEFPLPALALAQIYTSGKHADLGKMKQNLGAYFAACPASTDGSAQWLLVKDESLQPKVATALRAQLEKETDPKRLNAYATLWGLEFRTHPPKEHDALRAQVARNLERLEKLNPTGDADWQNFLIAGYKQSGASEETITAREDRLIHDFPHSNQAWYLVNKRWNDTHKEPENQTDAKAWAQYQIEYRQALKGWIRDYPDNSYLQREAWFYAIKDNGGKVREGIPQQEALATMDAYLQASKDYEDPQWSGDSYWSAARLLIQNHWQPTRALELLQQYRTQLEKNRAHEAENDNRKDDDQKEHTENLIWQDQSFYGWVLKAALEAGQPEQALKLKAAIEAPAPEKKSLQSAYWWNRARLEVIQKHTQDALAYYQLALFTRDKAPESSEGKLYDDLTDEAHALWKQQSGTETAWAVWSKQPASDAKQAAEGRWEKATKTIPDFELSDLSGKIWRLKDLRGKTVLITLWATWCGPCQGELPHLEKFYEKAKDRKNLQILTFDIDQDLGIVAPFVKKKGFTFPVLPAYSTVVSLLDGFAIPQTWLVDDSGVWRWRQIGYDGGSDADFEQGIQDKLDAAKAGQ
jgi:thiol-disulfide isomerase/thioredoxin